MARDTVPRIDHEDILNFTYGDMIKIRLNDSTCEYVVDKKVICKSSTLIREMLSASDLKKITIPQVSRLDLKFYVHWLYTGALATKSIDPVWESKVLASSYFLGIQLKDTKFRNDIVTALIEKGKEESCSPDLKCILLAYTGYQGIPASEAVLLQKLVVEMYARCELAEFEKIKEAAHPQFVQDLCSRLMVLRSVELETLDNINPSDFHEPASAEDVGGQEPPRKRRRQE